MSQVYARLYYHFVWTTWNRVPLLEGDVERHAYALIRRQCKKLGCAVYALGGTEDHVHLLVSLPRTLPVADFAESVKGASSRALNEARATDIWSFKWQGGYGVQTVSPGDLRRVVRYIEGQKQHHAEGRLWPLGEPVTDQREFSEASRRTWRDAGEAKEEVDYTDVAGAGRGGGVDAPRGGGERAVGSPTVQRRAPLGDESPSAVKSPSIPRHPSPPRERDKPTG